MPKLKMDTSWAIFILTVIALFFTLVKERKNNAQQDKIDKQQDKIYELNQLTNRLSEEIKFLSNTNINISNNIDTVTKKSQDLTAQNLDLSNKANIIIEEVKNLADNSHLLIQKLDIKTDQEFSVTGNFNLFFDRPFKDNEQVSVDIGGGNNVFAPLVDFKRVRGISSLINFRDYEPVSFRIEGQFLLISTKIYDIEGSLIAEVEDNEWRVSKYFVSKFNYDKKGFEVFDRKGNLAFSINILGNNVIAIRGIFISTKFKVFAFCADNFYYHLGMDAPNFADRINKQLGEARFSNLFKYTGAKWHSSRVTH